MTHVLLNFVLRQFPAARAHTRAVVRAVCADAPRRAVALACAAPTLRWVGVFVRVEGGPTWLYAWSISRDQEKNGEGTVVFGSNPPLGVTLTEMGELEGWEVLTAEGMEEFVGA